jgi:AcrR family transcriptional regulator
MRQSNRTKILTAAITVVEREGVTGVTFDSVAAESGLTKGGLLYHFPTRDALLLGMHQHLAQGWEDRLVELAGKTAEEASPDERLAAYARATAESATRADLLLALEASLNPGYAKPWADVTARWAPPAADAAHDPAALARFVAYLAADGLWLYESLTNQRLTPELRAKIADHIARS